MVSSGFLDLLIDTLCTSVMGRDARDQVFGDRSHNGKKAGGRDAQGKGYDEEDDFAVDDNSLSIQQQLQQQYHPQAIVDHWMDQADQAGEQESAVTSGIGLPLKQLQYDDRVKYAADVSVMESLGGPSLLVERARHESAAASGHDRASFENLDRQDPELAALVRLR